MKIKNDEMKIEKIIKYKQEIDKMSIKISSTKTYKVCI